MHVGKNKEEYKCRNLVIDEWTESVKLNNENKYIEIKDSFKGTKDPALNLVDILIFLQFQGIRVISIYK